MATKIKQSQKVILLWGAVSLLFYLSFLSVSTVDAYEWFIKKESVKVNDINALTTKIETFINTLGSVLSGLVVLYIVIAGVRYITAGNPEAAQAAKGSLINALIGLFIIAGAWGIFYLTTSVITTIFK